MRNKQQARHGSATVGDGVTAEPSEIKLKQALQLSALLIMPLLVWFAYYKFMYVGLANVEAMDFAQLGHNLSQGHGFTTLVLRPLALLHGGSGAHQPEVLHGPLYPLLLAVAFGILGAKDQTVVLVSSACFLATLPLAWGLASRLFNRSVAWMTLTALMLSDTFLEYALSGLHVSLYVLLTLALLYVFAVLASHNGRDGEPARLPKPLLALAGALAGALYLTDYIFAPFLLVVAVTAILMFPRHRLQAALTVLLPMLVVAAPWVLRNAQLGANPVLGLRSYEVVMKTVSYPAFTAYQMRPSDIAPSASLLTEVLKKAVLQANLVVNTFSNGGASWLLTFFIPGMLFQFANPASNIVRRVLIALGVSLALILVVLGVRMPFFAGLVPILLMYSVAVFEQMLRQARPSAPARAAVLSGALAFVMLSLASATVLREDKMRAPSECAAARQLAKLADQGDVSVSDRPQVVAWYTGCPSIFVPVPEVATEEVLSRVDAKWLFLTDSVRSLSPGWESVYDGFADWNLRARQAELAGKAEPPRPAIPANAASPVFVALRGFAAVGLGRGVAPTVVVAAATRDTAKSASGVRPKRVVSD